MDWSKKKITLYGGGLIGSGWATYFILKGWDNVTLYEPTAEGLQRSVDLTKKGLDVLVENGVMTAEEGEKGLGRVTFTTDRAQALIDVDFVQENGPETLEVRQKILADIEEVCPVTAIIASSTSSTPIHRIVEHAAHRARVLGGHPYHPVYLMPLVEVVGSTDTDPALVEQAREFYAQIGKVPVVLKKESPGYIASRLMSALYRECTNIVMKGIASMEDVDTAFCLGPGLRYGLMGPNTVYQLAGGELGIEGLLLGPIGNSGSENTMNALANWTEPPKEGVWYYMTLKKQMEDLLAHRDDRHGHNNAEIEQFRDAGLVKLLQHHGYL